MAVKAELGGMMPGVKAGIDHVQVIQFMCLTVHIQGRRLLDPCRSDRFRLVCYTGNRNEALHVSIAVNQMVRVHCKVIEHGLEFVSRVFAVPPGYWVCSSR